MYFSLYADTTPDSVFMGSVTGFCIVYCRNASVCFYSSNLRLFFHNTLNRVNSCIIFMWCVKQKTISKSHCCFRGFPRSIRGIPPKDRNIPRSFRNIPREIRGFSASCCPSRMVCYDLRLISGVVRSVASAYSIKKSIFAA